MLADKDNSRVKRNWPWWRLAITGLNSIALILTIIMSWHYLTGGQVAGCGSGSPCEQVLNSRWSTIAGILPVSGLALGVYLALLVAGFFAGPSNEAPIRNLAWGVMLILSGSIGGSAIWFTILQKWFIGEYCFYCMITHTTGMLLVVLVIWRAFNYLRGQSNSTLALSSRVLTGLILTGLLVISQVIFTPKAVYSDGVTEESLTTIDHHDVPILGSPDAPYIVTLLFDYKCYHCQQLHFMLTEAVSRYPGKLAFTLCPVPLSPLCNPYVPGDADQSGNSCDLAKTGLAVWLADREVFPVFENWMFTFESGDRWSPRSPEAARAKAVELVGKTRFEDALADPWIDQYLKTSTQIFSHTIQNGRGSIPKLIYSSRWVIPQPYSSDDLVIILRNSLTVPLP
jgi:uncharacterized membrane protein